MADMDKILAALIGHRVGIERLSVGVVRKVLRHLQEVEQDVADQIRGRLGRLSLNGQDMNDGTLRRLRELEAAVTSLIGEATKALHGDLQKSLLEVADEEVDFAGELYARAGLSAAFKKPSAEMLKSVVTSKPFQGKVLKSWTSSLAPATIDRVMSAVRLGITEGEGIEQIARRVVSPAKVRVGSAAMDISKRSATTVVRTAVNHVTNRAHQEFYKSNPDIFDRYQWISVLDGRTSPICRGRSGKVYVIGEGPLPPAHPNCRSTTAPVINGETIDDSNAYEAWLNGQTAKNQDDILGPTRGKLMRDGKLSLSDMLQFDGRPLTLEQMRDRRPEVFKRAGLGD